MYNKQNYNYQNNNQNNYNRPRQDVYNTTVDLNNISDEELENIKKGWVFNKQFTVYLGTNLEMTFDPDFYYYGYINDYVITRIRDKETNNFCFYLNLICSVYVNGYGLRNFVFKTSANFTTNSVLTQLLMSLGFNVAKMDSFDPNELIDKPIRARLTTQENDGKYYNIINDLVGRVL